LKRDAVGLHVQMQVRRHLAGGVDVVEQHQVVGGRRAEFHGLILSPHRNAITVASSGPSSILLRRSARLGSVKVVELFHSIQGEGKLAGVPSVFVRASGCNLRCVWCDTPYASWDPQGDEQSIEQIIDQVREFNARHVVLTGGEPMIMPQTPELCHRLRGAGYHITIETAATVFKPITCDLLSLSPKLSNSTPHHRAGGRFAAMHEAQRLRPEVVQQFIDLAPAVQGDFQLKFVVGELTDLEEIDDLLGKLNGWEPWDVLLMPEGTDAEVLRMRSTWLGEICKRRGFRYCPRLHIELYGNKRGT
jgi:7-carboxy-7-deazaguanine synthase